MKGAGKPERNAGKKRRFKLSLKVKLSVVLALLLLLTVLVMSELVLRGIESNQRRQTEAELSRYSRAAEQYVRQSYYSLENPLTDEEFMTQRGQRLALYITSLNGMQTYLYDASGREVGNSLPGVGDNDVADTLGFALDGAIAYETSGDSLIYFSPLRVEDRMIGVVRLQYSLKSSQDFLETIRELFRTAGIVVFAAGFVIGYLYFHRIASLIGKLRKASQQIRTGRYLRAIPVRRRDELGELGEDIYFMSGAIEEHIERQKQFIGNVSHEFKTPLTSIKAYVDLLDLYRDDPQLAAEAATSIGKETERLYEMVEKVLRLSAMEKYDFDQHAERVDLKELLEELCGRMRGKAERYGVELLLELEEASCWADRESLVHVFINLIDNAVKYNVPGGKVRVRCRMEKREALVRVTDTGIGIPFEAREKIFEPFYTVSKDRARSYGGTGLGLALVRELAEKQGGVISVSAPDSGPGTEVEVRLPVSAKK
ncbi:sensor histidine kinase [Cohnella algarum]|uniref:sensor histidine kinase n=1 Tax=Cohnella algarum TaxID=2044859 RepID=UPI0019685966|nr:HAMP domain-containing sensor histidine kinase [Cohnella algarum]MBN2982546.1 HAMP domain-containing histidine kinase [Cohnella algarum]